MIISVYKYWNQLKVFRFVSLLKKYEITKFRPSDIPSDILLRSKKWNIENKNNLQIKLDLDFRILYTTIIDITNVSLTNITLM